MPPLTPVANLSFVRTSKAIVNSLKQGRQTSTVLRTAFWWILSLLIATTVCQAQNIQHTENKPDLALRSDVRVDPSTLGMSFSIPLASYPGRAGHGLPVAVTYSSKVLRLAFQGVDYTPVSGAKTWTGVAFGEHSTAGWTSTLDPPRVEFTGMGQYYDGQGHPACEDVCFPGQNIVGDHYIKRIHIHMADGSSHELRQDDDAHPFPVDPFTGTFYAVDGSRMRFESGAASVLYMPDGSRYLFGAYNNGYELTATTFIDRNGNTLAYNSSARQWTDTLGRVITDPLPANPTANSETYFTAKLVGGADAIYKFRWKYLADVLTPDPATGQPPPLRYPGDYKCAHNSYQNVLPFLFSSNFGDRVCVEQDGSGNPLVFNPVVLAEVELPTGKFYRFSYTIYGEIDKIVLTSGATESFRYGQIATLSFSSVPYSQTNRGVIERRVSATGSAADESVWTYAVNPTNPYTVRTTQPDLSYSERLLYQSRYNGSGTFAPFGFDDARMGMAYEERMYNASGVMLRRQLSQWVEGPPIPAYSFGSRDPKLTRQVSILLDGPGGNALTTATEMTYDVDLNVTRTKRYDFVPLNATTAQTAAITSVSNGTPLRTQETDYVTDSAYRDRQLLGLPVETRVLNGAGTLVAKSSITYDEYNQHPLLIYGAVTGWQDPSTNVRGNATTVSTWLNTTNSFLSVHTQYDQYGNVRNVWDARDATQTNPSSIDYSATYQRAYPTSSTSADPDGAAPFQGLTSSTEYDFSTGLVTAQVDENGQRTSFSYNDPLNRLKQVIRAETVTQTSYSYNDTARTITATADLNFFNDNALKTMSLFDGLGRIIETRSYEDSTNYIASQTQYDALGRAFKASNPFRPLLPETAVWTTQAFDALGRLTSVTTPDAAVVTTSYSGTSVTVTDQTGKQRQSVTDALGRLVKVYEAPNDPAFNHLTEYTYDTLDNLTTVTQDPQTRTFVYDSLKRLTSATNPESGTITYQYDNNGNLLVKTDARNVSAHYEYDRLNRMTRRWYNASNSVANTTHNVPALPSEVGTSNETKFFYDAQTLPSGAPSYTRGSSLGRLVAQTYGAGSNGDYFAYDALGRVTLKIQQTGSVAYQVSAVYNAASAVKTMTYPSGRTISNDFDAAGRLTTFSGTLGDGVNRTYANEIIYSPFGDLAKEKFGTAAPTPVYNKLFYNVRGQLAEIRVSTSYTGPTDYDANRGAIVNNYSSQCTGICAGFNMPDNNGNLVKQEIHIPNQTMRWQQYEYDSLNRLKSAREVLNDGAEQWKQQFTYDRWGNRTINTAVTYGAGINIKAFSVNTGNNRLGVPAGQPGAMSYDNAGNLTNDTYSGAGNRTYDAENKITSAKGNNNQDQLYGYDGSGQRIKRTVNGVETWQVYGIGGELLAEYAANGAVANPQKEYGYRNGQLLVVADVNGIPIVPEFNDDFNDNSLSTVKWSVLDTNSPAVVSEQSQLLQIAVPGSTATYNGVISVGSYSLDGKMVQVEVPQAVSQAGWVENALMIQKDASNYFLINVGAMNLLFRSMVNGVNNQTIIPYNTSSHRFWRVRHDQTNNTIAFETSGNGTGWTTQKTAAVGFSLSGLRFQLHAGAYGTGNANPGAAQYDNFKLVSSEATYSTLTVGNAGFETPSLGSGWQYSPSGGTWTFASGAGLSANGSAFTSGNPGAPEGSQVAFLQGTTATITQSIAGFQSGVSYSIIFKAAQRGNCCNSGGQDFRVYVDEQLLGTYHPSGTSYLDYDAAAFTVSAGTHIIKFAALNSLGGDHTAFIDNVRIVGSANDGTGIQWLVSDQLGTPRMILDETGALANMKRHDYLPFGEELIAPTGGRSPAMGYADGDGVRQQFTLYERDNETGLDFAKSRYFSSVQGRFTSVDPAMGSAKSSLPQSWNRYSYTVNSPLRYIDPTGMIWGSKRIGNVTEYVWFDGDKVGNGYDVVTEFYVEGIINGRSVSLTLNPDGPRSALKQFLIDSSDLVVSALFYNDDYHVKGYAIGETREQFRERSRRGAIDPMPNQGFEVGLFFAGGPVGRLNRGTAAGILTPYGRAFQATTPEALAAREAIESGATLYRGGVLGQSAGPEGQFWALENPLLPGYAQRYGIPAANQNFNFIEYGRIKPGAPFITRPTPGGAPNAIEAVVDPNSVKLKGFNSQ